MTGIICALDVELEKIRELMKVEGELEYSGIKYTLGQISGKQAVCAVCGVGKVFAAICAQTMIMKFRPDEIINVGVAGSLSAELGIADIVIARQLVQHDMDVTALGLPRGQILGTELRYIPTTEEIRDKLLSCIFSLNGSGEEKAIKAITGTIASGDQFIAKKAQKQLIIAEFDALACEMEGAAIAQVCHINKVPFGVIRAISDSADSSSKMDYKVFSKLAAANTAKIMKNYFEL